jgi:hypothetical protein
MQEDFLATRLNFRQAVAHDFNYCARLYFAGMERIIEELKLERSAQVSSLRRQWELPRVLIALTVKIPAGCRVRRGRYVSGTDFIEAASSGASAPR